jgi:phage host-nuclease inhibitor protein Gam
MSDQVRFHATLDVTAASEQAVTEFAIAHLRERGFHVTEGNETWESVRDFLTRVHMSKHESLTRSIIKWKARGHHIPVRRGPTGRLIELASNPEFDAFVTRHKS